MADFTREEVLQVVRDSEKCVGADLSGLDLSSANLSEANLSGVIFKNTIMPDGTIRTDHGP